MVAAIELVCDAKAQRNSDVKRAGIHYWSKLVREGIPRDQARLIAAAIAKYDYAHRRPSAEQKHLITQYSALICRAQLWRGEMLLR